MPGIINLGILGGCSNPRIFFTTPKTFVCVRASMMATDSSSSNTVDTQSSVESDTSSTSCSATPAPSLLDRLKAPQKSQLAKKRAINIEPHLCYSLRLCLKFQAKKRSINHKFQIMEESRSRI